MRIDRKVAAFLGFLGGFAVTAWIDNLPKKGDTLAGINVAATWEWGTTCHQGDYLGSVVVPKVLVKEGEPFRSDDTAVEALYCFRDKVKPGESRAYFVRVCRQGADCTGDPAREPDARKLSNNL